MCRNLFGGSGRHDPAAAVPSFRAQVDDPVCGFDHIHVVLYHQDGVAFVYQTLKGLKQRGDVFEVQTRGRFVEDEQSPGAGIVFEVPGELEALGFAARKSVDRLPETDISQPDIGQRLEGFTDGGVALRRSIEKLQRRVDAAGLSDRIIFTGEIGPAQLPELVASLSLMVTPPRYEGYGMTPLEAMSCGVPIVASDEGFYAKMVGKNKAGILVKKTEPSEIAAAARELLENPMELALKSGNARSRALEQFGIEREIKGIHEVYEMLWDRG